MISLEKCELGPRRCGVNRRERVGFCGAGARARIALVSLHPWEEPCLTGANGAGTVFFSYCNLRCCFCQNHEISHEGKGEEVTDERLAEIFLEHFLWTADGIYFLADVVWRRKYVGQFEYR